MMMTMIEKLSTGEFAEAVTKNGHYTIRMHRDASNFAHVDVFGFDGRIVDMGKGESLIEAQARFESHSLFYGSVDRMIGK